MNTMHKIITFFKKTVFPRLEKISALEVYIFLTVVAVFFFFISFIKNEEKYTLIRVEVINRDWIANSSLYGMRAPFWLSDKIEVGLIQRSVSGSPIAEIVGIENYERGNEEAEVYLLVKVKTKTNQKTLEKTFLTYPLQVGGKIEFDFAEVKIPGQILDVAVPAEGYSQKEFIMKGVLKNQEKWFVDQIKVGEVMINRSTGEVVAEITNVVVEPSKESVLSSIGQDGIELKSNPDLSDVTITLKMKATQQDGRWYFGGHQRLRVGNHIWVYTENVDLREIEIQELLPV